MRHAKEQTITKGSVSLCSFSTARMAFITLHANSTYILVLTGCTINSGTSKQVPTPEFWVSSWAARGERGCPRSPAAPPTGTLWLLPSPAACHISTASVGTKRNTSRVKWLRRLKCFQKGISDTLRKGWSQAYTARKVAKPWSWHFGNGNNQKRNIHF